MPLPRPYRQHERVVQPFSGPLQQRLAEEWVRLHHEASSAVLLGGWADRRPCLAGLGRPGDVVDAVDGATAPVKDALLGGLVALYQEGEQLAGRIVMQSMLPKLAHYAFRTGLTRALEENAEDRLQLVMCEFWQVLGAYPVARRTSRVAANLALETLHRLTRLSRHPELPLDPQTLGQLLTRAQQRPGDEPAAGPTTPEATVAAPDPDGDLDALLAWGLEEGAITDRDAALLRQVYVGDPLEDLGSRRSQAVSAESFGAASGASRGYRAVASAASEATLRQRSRRARLRLAAAVAAHSRAEASGF